MENTENKNTCGCDCTMCHVGHHRRYRWFTIIVGVLLAFFIGMKLGEIKGFIIGGGEYGNRHERQWGMMDRYPAPMMQQTSAPASTTTTTPAPSAPTKN